MRETEAASKVVHGEMGSTTADSDLLQAGHVVKERWKVCVT